MGVAHKLPYGLWRLRVRGPLQHCRRPFFAQLAPVICAPHSFLKRPYPPVTSDCDASALLHSMYSSKTPRKLSSRSGRCGSRCRYMRCPLKPSGSSWPGPGGGDGGSGARLDQASARTRPACHADDMRLLAPPASLPVPPSFIVVNIRKILKVFCAHASYLLHRPWRRR